MKYLYNHTANLRF